jgi:hypothetical protein
MRRLVCLERESARGSLHKSNVVRAKSLKNVLGDVPRLETRPAALSKKELRTDLSKLIRQRTY